MDLTTENLFVNLILLSFGILILVKGSDGVIEGASVIARHYGIPDLVIGITLVSIGTSLPELATNVYAAFIGEGGVAIGNVVGSNITNVLLVAGIAVSGVGLLPIDKVTFYRDAVTMITVYILFSFFCYFSRTPVYQVNRLEGLLLFTASLAYIFLLLKNKRGSVEISHQNNPRRDSHDFIVKSTFNTFFSCLCVILGAKFIVDNVVWAARRLEIPEELVSATVIALGTSLPEVAVTVSGIAKKKRDIALGNIIGSNTFNILLVMGLTACIRPVPVSSDVRMFLIPYMLFTGLAFVVFMRTAWALVRWEGVFFLAGYAFFIGWNLMNMGL